MILPKGTTLNSEKSTGQEELDGQLLTFLDAKRNRRPLTGISILAAAVIITGLVAITATLKAASGTAETTAPAVIEAAIATFSDVKTKEEYAVRLGHLRDTITDERYGCKIKVEIQNTNNKQILINIQGILNPDGSKYISASYDSIWIIDTMGNSLNKITFNGDKI